MFAKATCASACFAFCSPGHETEVDCVVRLPKLDKNALAKADDSAQPSPSKSGLPFPQVTLWLHQ